MKKNVGIIGASGRMGSLLSKLILDSEKYDLIQTKSFSDLFASSDYIVDFSNKSLIHEILDSACITPKPLVICTTGFDMQSIMGKLKMLAKSVPIVITPNTSIGATLQLYITKIISDTLSNDFDIDIFEQHHKTKADLPSGTAINLKDALGKECTIHSKRAGNLPGEHEITFTSNEEVISIKHIALDRVLFAKGAMRVLDWLTSNNPSPDLYTMFDVLRLSTATLVDKETQKLA